MATRRRPPIPLVVLLVLALVAGIWWWSSRSGSEDTNRLSGSVEATEYQVAPAVTGRVTSVAVDEGAQVKAGQTLVRIDPAPLRLQVAQAKAGVDAATAALRQAKDDGTDAEVSEASARLRQAQAAVSLAQVQLGYANVTAPHAGTVVTVTTNVGQNAAPARALLTLVDDTDLWARVYVPEPQMGQVRVGRAARISADGVPPVDGTVTYVSDQAEFTPNTVETKDQRTKLVYEARVSLKSTDRTFKPGQPVDVTWP